MLRKLSLSTTLFFCALQAHAQLPPACAPGELPADDCGNACIYCDFNGYTGMTSGYTPGSAPGFCGSIENEQWLGFIAGASSATFTATAFNCINGNGVQIALYADCNDVPVPGGCNGGAMGGANNPVSINVALTPGANYFLLIDGYGGDQCDFTITVAPPSAVQAPPLGNVIGAIQGLLTLCPGATATYTVPLVTNAGAYTWTVPAGWLVNGDPGPLTVIAPGGNTVQITAGPNIGNNFQICVQAANSCDPDGPSICRGINVQNIPVTVIPPVTICFEDAPYLLPWGDDANTSGTYEAILQSFLGCDSTVRQVITVKNALITTIPLKTLCVDQCFSVCGVDYCDAGNYSVLCQSFQGCDSSISFSIQVLEPVANINGGGVLNCTTSSLVLSASPSPSVTIFNWKNLAGQVLGNGSNYTVTAPGTFILTATMNGGGVQCAVSDTIVITGNTTPPTLTAAGGNLTCAANSVQLTTTTNAPNPTWSWSGPNGFSSNSSSPTVSISGTYTVTVTSGANGCTATATANVTGNISPPSLTTSGATLTCAVTSAQITVNSNPAGSGFLWSGPNGFNSNIQTPTVTAAGTYTVTVTSSVNGCTSTATTTVVLNNTPPGATAATNGIISCPTPSVTLNGGPGTAGNTFAWAGPGFISALQNPSASTAGTYTLTVTGTNGCTSTATTVVTGNTIPPDAGAQGGTVTCGTPTITINGTSTANSPSFAWTGPSGFISTVQNPSNVTVPGIYTLTVTATNNCTMTATATVNGDFAVPNAAASGGIITCSQSSVTINGSSTTPGAMLLWNGPGGFTSTQPSVSVNTIGDYTLTVTAPNGCTSTAVAQVTPDSNLPNAMAQGGTLNCIVTSITLDGSTTTPNAQLIWSGPNGFSSTIEDPTISLDGTYTLTVTNPVNGCTVQASAVVFLNNTPPGASASGATVTCSSPSLVINSSSPTNGVTYAWSGPNSFSSSQQNPSVMDAGDYIVTVTNPANGCSSTAVATVVADQGPPTAASTTGTLTCTANTLVLNGSSSLTSTYSWSGPNNFMSTLQNPTVTDPGDYTLTATAANGCTGTTSVTVAQDITQPGATTTGNTLDCNNTSVGITADSPAGQSYAWTGPNNFSSLQQNPTVNTDGIYTVTVTGSNGCTSTATAVVALDLVTATLSAVAPDVLSCAALSVNIQSMVATSTSALQNLIWSGPNNFTSTDEDPIVSAPGIYTLTATTINGCTSTTTVTVNQDIASPNASAEGDTLTCMITTVNLNGSSISPSVMYSWTGPNNFVSNIEDPAVMLDGVYTLTVTGLNGCTITAQATVALNVVLPGAATVSSNDLDCDDLSATLTATSQVNGVSYAWTGPNNFMASSAVTTTTAPGDYQVAVTASNGCVSTSSVTVLQDILNPTAVANGGTIDCISGQATLMGNSPTNGVIYNWSGPNNFMSSQQNPVASAEGQYILTVTAPNGCTASATATVLENTLSPQVTVSGGGTVTCTVLDVTIVGSITTPGANGAWTGPNNFTSLQDSITVSAPGVYTFTVTAQNGCISAPTSTVLINTQNPQGVTAAGGLLNCSFPSINLAANSSSTGVIYAWTGPGNFMSDLPNPPVTNPGTYTLVVTDPVNGCTTSATASVTQDPTVPSIGVESDSITCINPMVILDATTNSAGVTFSWTGPNGFISSLEDPTTSVPGSYQVVATAVSSGCSATFNYMVTENVNLPGVTAQGDTLTCTLTSGQITSSSNAVGVIYNWSGPAGFTSSLPNPSVTLTGTYTVVTTGTNGCTSSAQVQVAPDVNAAVVSATGGTITCAITSITLMANANIGVNWQWSGPGNFSSTQQNPTATTAGNYIVAATAPNGCVTSFGVTVVADTDSPNVSIQTPDALDCTTTQVNLNATVVGTGSFVYQWSTTNGNIVSGANSLTPTVSQAGTYELLVTNTVNGCTNIETEPVISDDDTPNAADIQERGVKCFGDTNGSASIGAITGGTPPFVYSLDNQAFVPTTVFTSLQPGTHTLVVQDANGCEYETSFEILEPEELIVNLGPDTTIHLGDEILISIGNIVNFPDRVESTVLSPLDLPIDSTYLPTYSQRYRVTVVDSNGCKAADDRLIIVDRTRWVYIPNVFTPGSSENNILTVFGGPDVARIKSFLLFDRWGDAVHEVRDFEKNDLSKGWNGTARGQDVNPGVFVYYAEVLFIDGETVLFKGDVTLVR